MPEVSYQMHDWLEIVLLSRRTGAQASRLQFRQSTFNRASDTLALQSDRLLSSVGCIEKMGAPVRPLQMTAGGNL